jgi:Tetratricopeptide repeat
MKALKASIRVAVAALALGLLPGAPSWAGDDEASILTQQMKELYRAGKYMEALPLAQKALALREAELGPDDAKLAMPLNDLGTIHYNLGHTPLPSSSTSGRWRSGRRRPVRISRNSQPG